MNDKLSIFWVNEKASIVGIHITDRVMRNKQSMDVQVGCRCPLPKISFLMKAKNDHVKLDNNISIQLRDATGPTEGLKTLILISPDDTAKCTLMDHDLMSYFEDMSSGEQPQL